MTPETLSGIELSEREIPSLVRSWIKEVFPKNCPHREVWLTHLLRTEYWVLRIDPRARTSVRIAALTHDLPLPDYPPHPKSGFTPDEYHKYKIERSRNVARIAGNGLRKLGVPERVVGRTQHLIRTCEIGGSYRSDLVQAADSLSFLNVEAPFFISSIPNELTGQEIEEIINSMYYRISIPEARGIARPFYERRMAQLRKRRQQVWADYWRLVEEAKFNIGLSGKKIDALREAGDKVLSLG